MFKKVMTCVGSAIFAGSLVFGPVAANAAPVASPAATVSVGVAAKKAVKAGVSIQTIVKQTVTAKTVKVKPSYKKVGKPKIVSATLTVKQGAKSVAKNKASVNLKPGTYKVTQTVMYKLASGRGWGKTKTATKTQTLKVHTDVASKPRAKAPGSITVKKIPDLIAFAADGGAVKIKPQVKVTGKVKVYSKTVTVTKGKKAVARNKASVTMGGATKIRGSNYYASLPSAVGTYKVTTTVKYKVKYSQGSDLYWGKTNTKTLTQTLKVENPHDVNTAEGQKEVIYLLNKERKKRGMAPLKRHADLDRQAKQWAKDQPITGTTTLWKSDPIVGAGQSAWLSGEIFWPSSEMWLSQSRRNKESRFEATYLKKDLTHIGMAFNKEKVHFFLTATKK